MWTIPRATTHHIRPRNPCPPVPFCAELHVDTFCNSSLPSDFFVHFRVFSLHLGSQKNVLLLFVVYLDDHCEAQEDLSDHLPGSYKMEDVFFRGGSTPVL